MLRMVAMTPAARALVRAWLQAHTKQEAVLGSTNVPASLWLYWIMRQAACAPQAVRVCWFAYRF